MRNNACTLLLSVIVVLFLFTFDAVAESSESGLAARVGSDDAEKALPQRQLRNSKARIRFSNVIPASGTITDNPSQVFSVDVVDRDGNDLKNVKRFISVNGGTFTSTNGKRTEGTNTWTFTKNNLGYGSIRFYFLAKNKKNKTKSSQYLSGSNQRYSSLEVLEPPPAPTASPAPSTDPTVQPSSMPVDDKTATSGGGSSSSGGTLDGPKYGMQPNCYEIDTSRYNICLDLKSPSVGQTESWMEAFAEAKQSWEQVIVGHVKTYKGVQAALEKYKLAFGTASVPDTLDDMYIVGEKKYIDGPGKVLGSAGPTLSFTISQEPLIKIPLTGYMRFDEEDIGTLEANGKWIAVIKHEMAHVLGLGTLWKANRDSNGQFQYYGTKGIDVWAQTCNNLQNYPTPPVENDGGGGTAGGHWDELCFRNELMTGWLNTKMDNILSVLTVAAFEDIGYNVSYSTASTEIITSSSCCTSAVIRGRRDLQPSNVFDHSFGRQSSHLSNTAYNLAADEAANQLRGIRARAPTSLPDGFSFVGGDAISIVVLDHADGMVKEHTFAWDDVRHRL